MKSLALWMALTATVSAASVCASSVKDVPTSGVVAFVSNQSNCKAMLSATTPSTGAYKASLESAVEAYFYDIPASSRAFVIADLRQLCVIMESHRTYAATANPKAEVGQ